MHLEPFWSGPYVGILELQFTNMSIIVHVWTMNNELIYEKWVKSIFLKG
jgi:hypothetical protein